ncbi:bursicon receptor-like protein, partial [Leptotrombidium deliense]
SIRNNEIKTISERLFENNLKLTDLHLKGNPIETIAKNAFTNLTPLKYCNESRNLKQFPNLSGNIALQHLHIDRGSITLTISFIILSESRNLKQFPNLSGNIALQHLHIDRGSVTLIPSVLCDWAPKLMTL